MGTDRLDPQEGEVTLHQLGRAQKIKADKANATGKYYRLMMDHVKMVLKDIKRVCPVYDEKDGYEVAGFVWFQGWNDMCDGGVYPDRDQPGGYDMYSELLAHFIRDVREDLSAPEMRFVIGVMSLSQLIYMSEIGILLLKSKIPISFLQLFIIFLQRTIITLPVAALMAHLFFF